MPFTAVPCSALSEDDIAKLLASSSALDLLSETFGDRLASKARESGVLNVFLSSPFTGMELERQQLVEKYLPSLRRQCENVGVLLSVFDMR